MLPGIGDYRDPYDDDRITPEEWWESWYDHNDDRTEEEGEDY